MVGLGTAAGFQQALVAGPGKKPSPKVKTAKTTVTGQGTKKAAAASSKLPAAASSKLLALASSKLPATATSMPAEPAVAAAAASPATEPAAGSAAAASSPAPEPAAGSAFATAPASEKPREVGKVRVKYNHYDKEFTVTDGVLCFEDVDDQYAFSFVFKGDFTCKLESSTGAIIELDGGALRREMRKDPDGFDPEEEEEKVVGTFSGLSLADADGTQACYVISVDEDPVLAAAEAKSKTVYKASSAGGIGPSRGSALVTAELKGMSAEQLREGGQHYRELLEARDLEDLMAEGATLDD